MIKGIYVATYSQNAVEVIKDNGLGIELNDTCYSAMLDKDIREKTVQTMKQEIRDSGAVNVLVHGPFTEIVPASIDHRAVDMGIERLNEAYEICSTIGVKKMIVHSGYMPPLYVKEWHNDRSVEFWNRFMEDKPDDFEIAIENVLEDEPVMMKNLIDRLPDPRISLCLDIGHANWSGNSDYSIDDWIKILGHDLTHFHFHNNDGKSDQHNPINEGSMDIKKVLESISKYCDNDVTITIESRVCRESAEWLKDYVYNKTGGTFELR